jgi:hypothetical protein
MIRTTKNAYVAGCLRGADYKYNYDLKRISDVEKAAMLVANAAHAQTMRDIAANPSASAEVDMAAACVAFDAAKQRISDNFLADHAKITNDFYTLFDSIMLIHDAHIALVESLKAATCERRAAIEACHTTSVCAPAVVDTATRDCFICTEDTSVGGFMRCIGRDKDNTTTIEHHADALVCVDCAVQLAVKNRCPFCNTITLVPPLIYSYNEAERLAAGKLAERRRRDIAEQDAQDAAYALQVAMHTR